MGMSRKQYRIGDIAKQLNVQTFVVRFWEKELNIKPRRSQGGQRFYQTDDFEVFQIIKTLLYDHKFTLAGAKKKLAEIQKNNNTVILTTKIEPQEAPQKTEHSQAIHTLPSELHEKLMLVKKQLQKLTSIL